MLIVELDCLKSFSFLYFNKKNFRFLPEESQNSFSVEVSRLEVQPKKSEQALDFSFYSTIEKLDITRI